MIYFIQAPLPPPTVLSSPRYDATVLLCRYPATTVVANILHSGMSKKRLRGFREKVTRPFWVEAEVL